MPYLLQLKNIKKNIRGKRIINDLSLDINMSEIIGLLGPNGAGKTTTFYTILGLATLDSGKVIFQDNDISNLKPYQRSKLGISYLPQEPSIFRNLTVKNNIMGIGELFYKSNDLEEFYTKTIKEFDLTKVENSLGSVLSGGQRRKVEIARALASKPKLILLDEPFAGIDPIAIEDIKNILVSLSKKNISILITDHNIRETISLCKRSIIINNGKILAEGSAEELINNKKVKVHYFGEMFDKT